MTDFTLTPVAKVRGGRVENEDDAWGVVEAELVLADHLPEEALQGLDAFSLGSTGSTRPR